MNGILRADRQLRPRSKTRARRDGRICLSARVLSKTLTYDPIVLTSRWNAGAGISARSLPKETGLPTESTLFVFVCGGELGEGKTTLRQQFIQWAEDRLPNFIFLLAEDALKDNFVAGRRTFIDLAKFESVIAGIADCVLIFPESPGSFAETGLFSSSRDIRKKTLIINPTAEQRDSFLNLDPIHTIDRFSFLRPTVHCGDLESADFTLLGQRLIDRMKGPHRDQLDRGIPPVQP